jgi:outer membrane biosynthesis protein TonB
MLRYYSYSFGLHSALFIVLAFGLFQTKERIIPQEHIFTVELLKVSDITNVKPTLRKPKPKKPKPLLSQAAPKAALADPNAPEIPKPEPLVKPVTEKEIPLLPAAKPKKAEPAKKPQKPKKKVEKKKEEQDIDPFASVLKSVEQFEEKVEEQEKQQEEVEPITSNAKEEHYTAGIPLSISEKDAIRQQIMRHWSVVSGAKDAHDMVMVITISVAQDGTVTSHEIDNRYRYNKDTFYRAMVDSAVRAVYKASPLEHLPVDKYHSEGGWKKMEIHFDPKEMFY